MIRTLSILLFIFLLVVSFFSCGDETQETTVATPQVSVQTTFGKEPYTLPRVNENVKEFTNRWSGYQDYEEDVNRISKSNIEALKIISNRLTVQIDSLSKTIPDTLKTKPIIARMEVVKTRTRLLDQLVIRATPDTIAINKAIRQLRLAHNRWVFQMNEKLAKDLIETTQKDNQEKELEALKKRQDSILNAEIKDNQ